MTTTSANPDRLTGFVSGARAARHAMTDAASSAHPLALSVIDGCGARGVWATNLPGVLTLLNNMNATEEFVRGVADALTAADLFDGAASVSDVAIAARIAQGGYGVATTAVTINETTLLGEPANSGLVDDPICAANGNFVHRDVDLVFPGTSASLDIRRYYNSLATDRVGVFGVGWTSVFDVRLIGVDTDRIIALLPDGAEIAFTEAAGVWATRDRRFWRLAVAAHGWNLFDGPTDAKSYRFGPDGSLLGWRTGASVVELSRSTDGRALGITESRSGRMISIRWAGDRIAALTTDDRRAVEYSYGAPDTLVRAESASGWFDYHYDGRLMLSATDPDGVSPFVNSYDPDGRVVEQTSPFGRVTTYRYEIPGATVITDERGIRQAMVHDGRGNLTAVIDSDGSAMRIRYDDLDRAVEVIEKSGAVWCYEFDPTTGDLRRRVDPDGLTQSWEFDDRGRLVATVDRAGQTTRFEFGADHASPTRVIGPDGATTTSELDEWGQPTSVTDADGVTTRFVWDNDGQLLAIVDALGTSTTFEFDAAGRLTAGAEPGGRRFALAYDGSGRLVRSDTNAGVHSYEYSPAGRPVAGVAPGDVPWWATFGEHGAVATITDGLGATVTYEHDTLGNVVAVHAPDGAVFAQRFDEVGRMVAVVAPNGATSRQSYDIAGRLVEFTDPAGRSMRRTFDDLGRTVTSTAADGGTTRWTYHPNGELATVTNPGGDIWSTRVDAYGRIVEIVDPLGSSTRWTYSAAGRLTSHTDDLGRTEYYTYDATGRPVGEPQRPPTPNPVGDASFDYDRRGLLVRAVDPAGLASSFEYDVRGRLIAQTTPGDRTTRWSYDLAGFVAEMIDPAGVTTRVTRDPSGIVTALSRGGIGWERLLDANGRQLELRDHTGQAIDPNTSSHPCFGSRHRPPRDGARRDGTGRLMADGDGTVYRYDRAGRLVETVRAGQTPVRLEYDDDGLIGTEHSALGTRHFAYDAAGRVSSITLVGVGTTEIGYDSAGRRSSELSPDGVLTTYRWNAIDQLIEIARTSADGDAHRVEIGLDAEGRPERIGGAEVGGLTVMGARIFDPATHQFLSADPLMTVPGTNGAASAYTYAWHDPINFVDPSGLRPISVEDFEKRRQLEERGRLGAAWDAINHDPFGTLLTVGIVLAACTVPGAAPLVLLGAGFAAGAGFLQGNLDMKSVAVGAAFGLALPPGSSLIARPVGAGLASAGQSVADDLINGRSVDTKGALVTFGVGTATGGLGSWLEGSTTTFARKAAAETLLETNRSMWEQTLTGENPLSWESLVAGVSAPASVAIEPGRSPSSDSQSHSAPSSLGGAVASAVESVEPVAVGAP